MSEPVIQHWDRVIHKNVRSKDRLILETSYPNQATRLLSCKVPRGNTIFQSLQLKLLMGQNFTFRYLIQKFKGIKLLRHHPTFFESDNESYDRPNN